jgi:RimJ/RimL family protein N-acetyltransferase
MFPDLFRDDVFTLETPRLFLRWPKASDAPAIALLAGDRKVAEMTSHIPHPYPPEAATQIILAHRAANAEGGRIGLIIAPRSRPGDVLGMVSVQRAPASQSMSDQVTLGYWLGVPHWGNGMMTEAAQALIDALFMYTTEKSVAAAIRVTNTASRKVLEHCGFQYEGGGMSLRPAWGDSAPSDFYRLTRPLWSSLKGWRAPVPYGREVAVGGM